MAVTVAIAGLGTIGPIPAVARTTCPPPAVAPTVSLQVNPGKVVVSNSRSQGGLKRLQGHGATLRSANGWSPVGLTTTELGFSMNVRINAVPAARGRYCGYLEAVSASVGYDELTVYVARKYRPGSCQYGSIMEHENTHVLVFRRLLDQYAPRVERRLTVVAQRLRPVDAVSPKDAARRFKDQLRREVQPLFRELNRELDKANARLDTPQNYKREQARCTNW